MTNAPSKAEFLRVVRDEFTFLVREYGFKEQAFSEGDYENEFSITFVNATTKVYVEGINWGRRTMVFLGPKDGARGNKFKMVPVWAIVKMLQPDFYPRLSSGGQIDQVRANAEAVRQITQPVLKGDFSILQPVREFLLNRVKSKNL